MLETAVITILVVEDNPVHTVLVEDTLAAAYRIETAIDGEEALARLDARGESEAVDLLILDLNLPPPGGRQPTVEEGFRVLEHLCGFSAAKRPAVVVVSAFLPPDRRQRLKELGVRHILPKPFTSGELRDTVATALGEALE